MSAFADALRRVEAENPRLSLLLDDRVREVFAGYYDRLARWNAGQNISRRASAEEVARADVADAVVGLSQLETPERVLDVGSGGGFPGLAAAVLWPTAEVVLLEAARKRVSFLTRVVTELGLDRVRVEWGRAEVADEVASLVITRATLPWEELGLLRRLVGEGGEIAAFVGQSPSEAQWAALVRGFGWRPRFLPYAVAGLGRRALAIAVRP